MFVDQNLISALLIENPLKDVIGDVEWERLVKETKLYDRYNGDLNVWTNYEKPKEIDYEPTKLSINYPRKLVDTIAAWQFEKEPKVTVPPDILDDPALMTQPNYTPSDEQQAENSRAKIKERLLQWVWDDNRMHEKLLVAAKDRAISTSGVYARLHYDTRRGGIRVYWHPSTEVIAVHNEWDADELSEVHFIAFLDPDQTQLWRLSYYLVWHEDVGKYDCEIFEAVYDENFHLVDERVPRQSMGLDFIPVVEIPVDKLTGATQGQSELEKMIDIADEIDRKLSDYSDALRFEMFAITLLTNVDEDPKNPLKKSPAAVWNLGDGDNESGIPKAEKLEGGFEFKEAIDSYIDRMYEAMHEISEVPIVNTADMKTGGINDVALQLLFSAIISKTQRAWVIWQSRLRLLNEYILRYMKARKDHVRFKYEREWVDELDDYYYSDIIFNLPTPQDRAALITQLSDEIAMNIESIKGAITRSGKENAEAKFMEILQERNLMRVQGDPYNEAQTESQPNDIDE